MATESGRSAGSASRGGNDACGRWAGSAGVGQPRGPLRWRRSTAPVPSRRRGRRPDRPAACVGETSACTPGSDPSSPHPASSSTAAAGTTRPLRARRRGSRVLGMPPIVPAASRRDRVSPRPACGGRGGDARRASRRAVTRRRSRPSRDDRPAGDDRVAGTDRAAAQPRLDRVRQRAGEGRPGQRPHGDVADRARLEHAELAGAAEARRPAERRHLERHARRAVRTPRCGAWRATSPGAPRATAMPSRRTTSRRRRARPRTPAARRSTTGAMPDARIRLLDGQCAADTPAAPRRRISSAFGITQWATHVRSLAQPVRSRYSVGRQPKWATLYSSSSTFSAKCVWSRTSSRSASSAVRTISSSVTLNGEHGASAIRVIAPHAAVVVAPHRLLAGGEDRVVVVDDVIGRQPAVLLRQRHRSARRMEAHADVAGGLDLGGQQIAGAVRVQVEVIGRRRAPGQRQLGEPDPRRHVHRLGVERRPQRIQRRQPSEQRLVGHRRVRPRQVLEHVVVGVHQARRDQAVGGVDHRRRVGRFSVADRLDQAAGDRHPTARDLAPLGVERAPTHHARLTSDRRGLGHSSSTSR